MIYCLVMQKKNGLIKKIRLISKFLTSHTVWQTLAIHILHNISRNKDNQTMKFGQEIKYNRSIFLQKSWWKSIVHNLSYIKNKLYKTLDYCSRDRLKFDFSENALGIISPPNFMYYFSRRLFLTLYSINWPSFIVWLPLLLEMFANMCIAIAC